MSRRPRRHTEDQLSFAFEGVAPLKRAAGRNTSKASTDVAEPAASEVAAAPGTLFAAVQTGSPDRRTAHGKAAAALEAANDAATDAQTGTPRLFRYAPNLDVHLLSPAEAVAEVTGPDPEMAVWWLQDIVGTVRPMSSRKIAFPTRTLDRLLHVRTPAIVSLDAVTLAIARALWAHELGYKPLKVTRKGRRLIAASPRWPTALKVVDAPWPAIVTLERLKVPLAVSEAAADLMTDKLVASGAAVATAGLAGSAVVLEAFSPQLLERLHLPGLAYAGGPSTGRYRLPLLLAKPLLSEPSVAVPADVARKIRHANRRPNKLESKPGLPYTLYDFQKRDAGKALRILDVTGGVMLAGDMGSGKASRVSTPVLTPSGWVEIGDLQVGDEVIGADGRPTVVEGVFPQGVQDIYDVAFTDGAVTNCVDEHLWAVADTPDADSPHQVRPLHQIRRRLHDDDGNPVRYVPLVAAVQFTPQPAPLPTDPYQLGRHLCDGPADVGERTAAAIPDRYLFASVDERVALLQGLLDSGGQPSPSGDGRGALVYTCTSPQLADDVQHLTQSLGGTGQVTRISGGRTADRYQVDLCLPDATRPFRLPGKAAAYVPQQPVRAIAQVRPAGRDETVCIKVAADDGLYVTEQFIVTHNTTVSLALVHELDIWPLLIVGPLSSFTTWTRQLTEMGKSFRLLNQSIAADRGWFADPDREAVDAVILSYDRLHAFVEDIEAFGFAGIVTDEMQQVRTATSRRSRAIRRLAQAVPARIGLTGTPIANKVEDILAPGAFLNPSEWKPKASSRDLEDLYPGNAIEAATYHLHSLMVRRKMADTGVRLPDKHVKRVMVELTPDQLRALRQLEEDAQAAKAAGELGSHLHIFARLQKMRQIVACPSIAGIHSGNPKVEAAAELVEEFASYGRKTVVFCANRATWVELGKTFEEMGVGWVGIWGSSSVRDRAEAERRFHADDDVKVFVGTIASCSTAITLSPTATAIVFTDYSYSPADLQQAEARARRMNQTAELDVIYLHAEVPGGSLDDRFVEILNAKQQLFAQVVDLEEFVDPAKLAPSLDDLLFLLTGKRDDRDSQMQSKRQRRAETEQTMSLLDLEVLRSDDLGPTELGDYELADLEEQALTDDDTDDPEDT